MISRGNLSGLKGSATNTKKGNENIMANENNEVIDYTGYLVKEATDLQVRFAEWLQTDQVGYDPENEETKADAFAEGVRLATALRIPFQASPFNREATSARREELEKERAANKAKRAAEKEQRAAEKAAKKTSEAKSEVTEGESEAPAKPVKAAKPAASAKVARTEESEAAKSTAPKARPAARRAPRPAPAAPVAATTTEVDEDAVF